jgi:uncharacterized protein YcfJ
MNKNGLTSLLLGGICLTLLAACNDDTKANTAQSTAAAVEVKKTPHEVCEDRVVTTQKPVKDKDRIAGTVAGALVGGVVGHEVGGHGTKQDVATVAGAAAGGYTGNRVQKSVQKNATEQTTERVCHTEYS